MSILYNRAVLLASIETTFRTDVIAGTPIGTPENTEAVLVEDPVFGADATILDRNNVKFHLSPDPGAPGRKIATISFSHEVRHNGNIAGTVAGKLGRLLRGCGMAETAYTGGEVLDDAPIPVNAPTGQWTFVDNQDYDGALPRVVEITTNTIGASGPAAATVDIFSPAVGGQAEVSQTNVALNTGMDLVAGSGETCTIDPTTTVDIAAGDTWIVNLTPPGFSYEPVSTGFESLTFYLFYDGLRHIMTGARGTFTVEAEAGNYAKFNFTFTGDYNDPTDTAMPTTAVFEDTVPAQVELTNLTAAGGEDDVDFGLCAQSFSIDMGNNVVARECINDEDSLAGALITGRSPTAAFNPETELEATHPFWANLNAAARVSFSVRCGSAQGNVVTFWAPYAQYASLAYSNRNDIRAYDVNMRLNTGDSTVGNDELRITFS